MRSLSLPSTALGAGKYIIDKFIGINIVVKVNIESIDYLWNNGTEEDWKYFLNYYYDSLSFEEAALDKEMETLKIEKVRQMSATEFYDFLHNKYFLWKYGSTYLTKRQKDLSQNTLQMLREVQVHIFTTNLDDIKLCLENLTRLKGIGTAGASGLLSLLFPHHFGTVDKFVVIRLREITNLKQHQYLLNINPSNITSEDGTVLISIMREKSQELNQKFSCDFWTPRKIDMVLWAFGRTRKQTVRNKLHKIPSQNYGYSNKTTTKIIDTKPNKSNFKNKFIYPNNNLYSRIKAYIATDWTEQLPKSIDRNTYTGLSRPSYSILCVLFYLIKDFFILVFTLLGYCLYLEFRIIKFILYDMPYWLYKNITLSRPIKTLLSLILLGQSCMYIKLMNDTSKNEKSFVFIGPLIMTTIPALLMLFPQTVRYCRIIKIYIKKFFLNKSRKQEGENQNGYE